MTLLLRLALPSISSLLILTSNLSMLLSLFLFPLLSSRYPFQPYFFLLVSSLFPPLVTLLSPVALLRSLCPLPLLFPSDLADFPSLPFLSILSHCCRFLIVILFLLFFLLHMCISAYIPLQTPPLTILVVMWLCSVKLGEPVLMMLNCRFVVRMEVLIVFLSKRSIDAYKIS